jgi:environmental stress-induced protein Ves
VAIFERAVRLLPAEGHVRMPWRNGGGETVEIASEPPQAGLTAFDWRVSIAQVARDGPFSRFPGVARTLVLLDGAGLRLDGANVHHTLANRHAVLTLRGDDAVECSLLEGAVRIFNVMVRSPRPATVAIVTDSDVDVAADGLAIGYAARGTLAVTARAGRLVVKPGDAFIHATGMPFTVRPIGDALGVIAMIPGRPA